MGSTPNRSSDCQSDGHPIQNIHRSLGLGHLCPMSAYIMRKTKQKIRKTVIVTT